MENQETLGQKRVRLNLHNKTSFSKDDLIIGAVKGKTAELIDLLEEFKNNHENQIDGETARLIATAQTKFEEAALWGVKAVTK